MLSNQTKRLAQQISILKQQLEAATNYAIELEAEVCSLTGIRVEDLREEYDVHLIEE